MTRSISLRSTVGTGHLVLLLLVVLLPARPAEASLQVAQSFVQEYEISLNGPLYCYTRTPDSWRDLGGKASGSPSSSTSSAEILVQLARHRRVVVLIHGFYWKIEPYPDTGRPNREHVLSGWRGHLDFLHRLSAGDQGGTAVCMISLDSSDGYGSNQRQIGNFLTALRWLKDSPAYFDAQARITLVGYSAGGNYAKDAYLQWRDKLASLGGAPTGGAPAGYRPTRTTIAFLGTPHAGTDTVALLGVAGELIALSWEQKRTRYTGGTQAERNYLERSDREFQARKAAELRRIYNSRGTLQLSPGNRQTHDLNQRFFAATHQDGVEVFNFYSPADIVAPAATCRLHTQKSLRSEWLPRVYDVPVDLAVHNDFMDAASLARNRAAFERLYSP